MSTKRTVTSRMTLDVVMPDIQKTVTVTQGDINRRFEITLVDNGKPFQLGVKWTVALAGVKPSGAQIYNSCTVSQGKIIYDFAGGPEIATEAGAFDVQFDIYDEVGDVLASPKIWISVLPNKNREMQSEDQFTATQDILRRINETEEEKLALVRAAVDDAEKVGKELKTAESLRETAEQGRVEAESARVQAEKTRVTAEEKRQEAIVKYLTETGKEIDKMVEKAVGEQVADSLGIVDNLETDDPYKALSAAQGVVLKQLLGEEANKVTDMESGNYIGTNAYTLTLTFSFVPKVILIIGDFPTDSSYNVLRSVGLICPQEGVLMANHYYYSGSAYKTVMMGSFAATANAKEVVVNVDGTTVTLKDSSISTPDSYVETFNRQRYDSGRYWYYAWG